MNIAYGTVYLFDNNKQIDTVSTKFKFITKSNDIMKFNTLQEAMEYVSDTIDTEGFEYTFCHYSDFNDIKDEKFHELRKAYLKSITDLCNYIDSNINN